MTLYEKILDVRKEYGLGVVEYLEKAPMSSDLYYAIKRGDKKELDPRQASDMHQAFPKFSKEWFNEVDITPVKEPEENYCTIKEPDMFAIEIMNRDEELTKDSIIYRNFITGKVNQQLLKITNTKESFLEYINK